MISIVTVVYQDFPALVKTYDSLCLQNSNNFQWVVVDGGSTDGSLNFLEEIDPEFICDFISEKDGGIYDAMNKGIDMAKGSHIVFLNAGDELENCNVVEEVDCISHNNKMSILLGDFIMVCGKKKLHRKSRDCFYLKHSLPTSHQAIFYPSEFIKNNYYDTSYRVSSDYYLTCLAFKKGVDFQLLSKVVSRFYVGGVSSQNRLAVIQDMNAVQRDVLDLSLPYRLLSAFKRAVNMFIVDLITKFG